MPGSIIAGVGRKALQMALAGIFDLRIHQDDIVAPLRQRGVMEPENLHAHGETPDELAAAVAS